MIIVSGLARSGTSLMMRFLYKGGIPVLHDGVRKADDNNPNGFYEVERIGEKLKDNPLLFKGRNGGLTIKVLSPFLDRIEDLKEHRIIYMERALPEVSASMEKMLGTPMGDSVTAAFDNHVSRMKKYLKDKDVLFVSYSDLVNKNPKQLRAIREYVPRINLSEAVGAIDKKLYRNKIMAR